MKQIDFSKLEIEVEIGKFSHEDVRAALGNMLFRNATSLETDQLARKIFNAPQEPVELEDSELRMILDSLHQSAGRYSFIKAIKENAKEATPPTGDGGRMQRE